MSDKHEQEGELIETPEPESAADGADDTQKGEQTQVDLDEAESPEVAKGEEQRQKKIAAYQAKVDRGEITLDSLPKDEKWLAAHLTPRKVEVNIDKEAIRRAIQEEKDEETFLSRKQALADADLPSDKINKLNEKFKQFRAKGLSKLDALDAAREIAQIDLEEVAISPRKKAMRLPTPGGKSQTKDYAQLYKDLPFSEAMKVIPEAELDRLLKESVRSV